jgi:two-component system alkaline phosphatase synthesis response regulator PhoP
MQVLVVEDDTALQLFYCYLLEKFGYEVRLAEDGYRAIELLERYTPDLIFLDMRLPQLNGEAVLEYILERPDLAQTYLIVASAASEYARIVDDVDRAEFWLKPIRPAQIQRVAQSLQQKHAHTS